MELSSGNIVCLLDDAKRVIADKEGIPIKYQVVSVYRDRGRVSLVTSYGEYVGLHPLDQTIYISAGPLFNSSGYEEGSKILWIDNDAIYEGIISKLHDSYASVTEVKKLMPVDYKARVPYWKIYEDRKPIDSASQIDNSGDDLERERITYVDKSKYYTEK